MKMKKETKPYKIPAKFKKAFKGFYIAEMGKNPETGEIRITLENEENAKFTFQSIPFFSLMYGTQAFELYTFFHSFPYWHTWREYEYREETEVVECRNYPNRTIRKKHIIVTKSRMIEEGKESHGNDEK